MFGAWNDIEADTDAQPALQMDAGYSCICTTPDLMCRGCTCGQMEREREKADEDERVLRFLASLPKS